MATTGTSEGESMGISLVSLGVVWSLWKAYVTVVEEKNDKLQGGFMAAKNKTMARETVLKAY